MDGVKRESNEAICRGCLSADRRLAPPAYYDLFFTLLDEKQKLEALKSPTVHLCWECNAMLRKMKLFQTQTRIAQRLLEELANVLPPKGLSQLTTSYKQDYDVIIEENIDGIEEQLAVPAKEEIKIEMDVFNHNLNSDDDQFFEETDDLETQADLNLFVETTESNLIEPERRKKYKRKLKRVKTTLHTKNKRKKIEIDTVKKGNRAGLRSSGVIPPLHFMKNEIKVDSAPKRKLKQPKRKCLNSRNPTNRDKVTKEKQIPCSKDTETEDLQNMITNDDAKANTDLELETVDVQNEKENIDDIKQNKNYEIDDSDGENDNCDDNDPDFEEDCNKYGNNPNPNNTVKSNKKNLSSRHKWLRGDLVTFDVINELDKYFTKVDLSPEEVKNILDHELSYETEEQPYGCNYCGYCFQLSRTLIKHKRKRHRLIAKCTNPVYLMYRCKICNKIIRTEHAEAHMKYLHRWRYYCKECDKYFWDVEEAKSHCMELHNPQKIHSCSHCPYVGCSRKALEGHVRSSHTPVACDECGKIMSGEKNLKTHKRKHESDDSAPELRYCVSCDKQFKSIYSYEMHVKTSGVHNGKAHEKMPCKECGKVMVGRYSLQAHYDRFHSGKRKFQCSDCDKYYSRKSGLRYHIDTAHLKKKLPKDKLCSFCGRGFAFARTLIHHIRTHTGERPHVCPHCPAAFAQPCPLRKHLATQHGQTAIQKKVAPTTQACGPTVQE